ncbi:MAG: hypothetical protein D6813_02585, partial [Calditrichaeota bacterium]
QLKRLGLFVILCSGLIFSAQRTPAQNLSSPLERKLTVAFQNTPLPEVLKVLSEKARVHFIYNNRLLDSTVTVSKSFRNESLAKILDDIFTETDIRYLAQTGGKIVLTRAAAVKKKYGRIKGRVVNRVTGEGLPDANILLPGLPFGTASNQRGYFELILPVGQYDLQVSVIGYEKRTRKNIEVKAGKVTYLTIRLQPTVLKMPEVAVHSTREVLPQHMQVEPSVITFSRERLISIPTVGEPDLFRAIQTLPGVSAPNDYSNELYIRGGNADQNLILLDGAVVYNPYHLFGLAGAFNPDIVEQVNLSLGGFSARYGDRLSSVIDVRTLNRSSQKVEGFGNFSLMSSKLTLFNQVTPRFAWMLSARRTYHDFAAKLFVGQTVPYYFYDLYGKIIYRPGEHDLFFISGFFSRDQFSNIDKKRGGEVNGPLFVQTDRIPEDQGYFGRKESTLFWDNIITSLHWQHQFSPGNHLHLLISQSNNPSDFAVDERFWPAANASAETRDFVKRLNESAQQFTNLNGDVGLRDRSARGDLTFRMAGGHTISLGAGGSQIRLRYVWQDLFNEIDQNHIVVFFDKVPGDFSFRRDLWQVFSYVEDTWRISERLTIRTGLRLTKRSFHRNWSLAPRFNLKYHLFTSTELRFAYGRFFQGLATSLEEGQLHFMPLFFPAEKPMPLEKSDHLIVGITLLRKPWSLKVDAYYKHFSGLLKAKTSTPEFKQGSGQAYGMEISLKKPGDRLNFEMNYALSYSRRRFDGVTYFTSFDQRHVFSLFGNYALGKDWQLNFRWVLSSGRPFTPDPVLFADRVFDPLTGEWIETGFVTSITKNELERKNRARFPIYHRMDLMLMKRVQKRGWTIIPYIQVLNVYFRRNVLFYDWDLQANSTVKRNTFPMMPLVPTFGVSVEF